MPHFTRPNFFAGSGLDRRGEARDETDWRDAARADPDTRYVVSRQTTHLVFPGAQNRVAYLDNGHPLVTQADPGQFALLGWLQGVRHVLIDLRMSDQPELPQGSTFEELRPLLLAFDEQEAALLAYARALAYWRARARHCGVCGSPTEPRSAGHVMHCLNPRCAAEFFPRLDPAIIVLISDGERALLGRQPGWPPGRYSTIAGFVEPVESLEDAVVREVMEETGVPVTNVRYQSSQPWPFPSSLMLGFRASAVPGSPIRVTGELEDAQWFTPQRILEEAVMPPNHSISYRLISDWLTERAVGPAL